MSEGGHLDDVLRSRIARFQKDAGLSVDQLAERSLIGPDRLRRILAGEEAISLDMVILFAGALRIEPAALLGGIRWEADATIEGQFHVPGAED